MLEKFTDSVNGLFTPDYRVPQFSTHTSHSPAFCLHYSPISECITEISWIRDKARLFFRIFANPWAGITGSATDLQKRLHKTRHAMLLKWVRKTVFESDGKNLTVCICVDLVLDNYCFRQFAFLTWELVEWQKDRASCCIIRCCCKINGEWICDSSSWEQLFVFIWHWRKLSTRATITESR